MNRIDWLLSAVSLLGATGADAAAEGGDGLWAKLLGAAASSGLIGLLLLWFVYTGRQERQRERDEALAREKALALRLNTIEDEIRGSLAARLNQANEAMENFEKIARRCADRAGVKPE